MRSCPVCGSSRREQLTRGFFRCQGQRRIWSDDSVTREPVGFELCGECYLDTGEGSRRAWLARWFGWHTIQ